jgi:hypothetical protein
MLTLYATYIRTLRIPHSIHVVGWFSERHCCVLSVVVVVFVAVVAVVLCCAVDVVVNVCTQKTMNE